MASAPDTPPPALKKRRARLIAVALALLLGICGAGVWYLMGPRADAGAAQHRPAGKPVFAVLDPFTVNLRDERGERFAQVGVTLEISGSEVDALIKDRLPAVRNNVLLLLASKRVEELLTPEGKQALAGEVRQKVADALAGGDPATADAADAREPLVRSVLFSQFIVQ